VSIFIEGSQFSLWSIPRISDAPMRYQF